MSERSDADIARNIERYVSLLQTFREAVPSAVRLGLYSMVPVRNLRAPVRGNPSKIKSWRDDNQRLQPIADLVDIIFPSLYTFYDDPVGWVTYAKANISQVASNTVDPSTPSFGRNITTPARSWPQI